METPQAKIRNKLSPFWTLTQIMGDEKLWFDINSTETGRQIIQELVQQCNKNKNEISKLLNETELSANNFNT